VEVVMKGDALFLTKFFDRLLTPGSICIAAVLVAIAVSGVFILFCKSSEPEEKGRGGCL